MKCAAHWWVRVRMNIGTNFVLRWFKFLAYSITKSEFHLTLRNFSTFNWPITRLKLYDDVCHDWYLIIQWPTKIDHHHHHDSSNFFILVYLRCSTEPQKANIFLLALLGLYLSTKLSFPLLTFTLIKWAALRSKDVQEIKYQRLFVNKGCFYCILCITLTDTSVPSSAFHGLKRMFLWRDSKYKYKRTVQPEQRFY